MLKDHKCIGTSYTQKLGVAIGFEKFPIGTSRKQKGLCKNNHLIVADVHTHILARPHTHIYTHTHTHTHKRREGTKQRGKKARI